MHRHVGIDVQQFLADPHATGIQRVLHALAVHWPRDIEAHFVVESRDELRLMEPDAAAQLIGLAFEERTEKDDLAARISDLLPSIELQHTPHQTLDVFSHWLLPEVSYLPSVATRAREMNAQDRLAMIGYDALPMTEPGNYRFVPGAAERVSEYFRLLASARSVVAISQYSADSICGTLRRSRPISVAHPGGDHVPIGSAPKPDRPRFLRVGTMEARKHPVEITRAFCLAVDAGLDAELMFIGRPSASDESINSVIRTAITQGYPITWIPGAPDSVVYQAMSEATYFLSIGVEGYAIPVLEAIRLGTPVLFSGIQPAAELMIGRGASPINAGTPETLAQSLTEVSESAPPPVQPENVPTWSAFVNAVSQATVG